MNNSIFIIALIVASVFGLFKFLEMRFITKKNKPLKYLIRDSILVYFSVVLGNFILEQIEPLQKIGKTEIFTNEPGF